MLPKSLESKMPYEIELGGVMVKVDVLDPFWLSESVLEEKLSEFEKQLRPRRIVGIGFECLSSHCWLLLSAGNHCLIIKLLLLTGPCHHSGVNSLKKILMARDVTFVGVNSDNNKMKSKWVGYLPEKGFAVPEINVYEIYFIMSRIYKKPALLWCGSLQKLGSEVGLEIKPNITRKSIDWNAKVFSEEDIKFAVYDVYYSCRIADKLKP